MKIELWIFMLIILLAVVISGCTTQEQVKTQDSPKDSGEVQQIKGSVTVIDKDYCQSDDDCACGMSLETADCYVGNRDYIDKGTEEYAQDGGLCNEFCSGQTGNLEIKCVDNTCIQI